MRAREIIDGLKISKYSKNNYFSSMVIGETDFQGSKQEFKVYSPINNDLLGKFKFADSEAIFTELGRSVNAYQILRDTPAPIRGKLVKKIGELVGKKKELLANLITLEVGKTLQEAQGEVQEWIDICDYSVGLSRQLLGLTMASERPNHRLMEQWHPIGPVLVISAFNFPMAVWAWNSMIGFVCGDSVVWKPSPITPLCSLAAHEIVMESISRLRQEGINIPHDIHSVLITNVEDSKKLVENSIFPLVSATGSVEMGRDVACRVAKRFGKSLLELGGNNALIISKYADIDLALRATTFSSVGTTGQRCTTLRRLIIHESKKDEIIQRLIKAYDTLKIGDPFDEKNYLGPIINHAAFKKMQEALNIAIKNGGRLIYGGERVNIPECEEGYYVKPAIVEIAGDAPVVMQETFAPILYVSTYINFEDAIKLNNSVPQGLSSALFTTNILEAEKFMSASGSDCGLVNINVGTSGAEIGGAFGGEKETGGGRESGSDAWKNYMRRTTNTINYSDKLPLSQGIRFDV